MSATRSSSPLLSAHKIERTPSILVLDSQQVSQVTLVGCSFQDIESLFEIRGTHSQRYSQRNQNSSHSVIQKCFSCEEPMNDTLEPQVSTRNVKSARIPSLTCTSSVSSKPGTSPLKTGFARTATFDAGYCSYLSSNSPSFYQDYSGGTYLSTPLIQHELSCSKGHNMDLIPFEEQKEYKCIQCKKLVTKDKS